MACYLGKDGLLYIDSDAVGEITNFSLEETADTVECTAMGDTYRTYKTTFKAWTASAEVHWDPDDSGQDRLIVGNTVTVDLYPEGNSSTDTRLTGSAIVTALTQTAPFDGLVTQAVTLQGTGTLLRTVV